MCTILGRRPVCRRAVYTLCCLKREAAYRIRSHTPSQGGVRAKRVPTRRCGGEHYHIDNNSLGTRSRIQSAQKSLGRRSKTTTSAKVLQWRLGKLPPSSKMYGYGLRIDPKQIHNFCFEPCPKLSLSVSIFEGSPKMEFRNQELLSIWYHQITMCKDQAIAVPQLPRGRISQRENTRSSLL